MRPIKGAKNHVFLGPHLGPQKVLKNGAKMEPKWSHRGAKLEVEIRKKREKLEVYAQDRSKGGLGTFAMLLGRFGMVSNRKFCKIRSEMTCLLAAFRYIFDAM